MGRKKKTEEENVEEKETTKNKKAPSKKKETKKKKPDSTKSDKEAKTEKKTTKKTQKSTSKTAEKKTTAKKPKASKAKSDEKVEKKATKKKTIAKKTKSDTKKTEEKTTAKKTKSDTKKTEKKTTKKKITAKKTKSDTKKTEKKTTKKTPQKKSTKSKVEEKVESETQESFALIKREEVKDKKGPLFIVLLALSIPILLFTAETTKVDLPTIDISAKVVQVLSIFPILILVVLAMLLTKFAYDKTSSFHLTTQLTDEDNPAVGLSLVGYLFGMGLALVGAMSRVRSGNILETFPDIISNLVPGFVISLVLLIIAQKVLDHLVLYRFSIDKELATDRNLGTGAICCGGFIATGCILMNSFKKTIDDGFLEYSLAIVSTFIVGQIIFVVGSWTFAKMSRFNFHYEIEKRDNVSAGILLGGLLVGIGLVISASVSNIEWENPPLFFTENVPELEQNLSQKVVNKEMLGVFLRNECPLNPKATIQPLQPNEWKIKNPEYYIQYIVKKQRNYFAVYSDNVLFMTVRKATTAFVAGLLAILILLFIGLWAAKLFFFRVSLEKEVEQKNPAVALALACTYIVTGMIIQALLKI